MKKLTSLLLFVLAASSFGANWYVRPNYTSGSHTGADWNNAWNDWLGITWSIVNPGDIIWFAGGGYNGNCIFQKSGDPTLGRITIQRVTASDAVPTAAAGYTSALNQQAVFPQQSESDGYQVGISFNQKHDVTFDGGVDDGVAISVGNFGGSAGVSWDHPTTKMPNTTLKHVTMLGPSQDWDLHPGTPSVQNGYGIITSDANSGDNITNMLISHCKVNGVVESIDFQGAVNSVVEYTDMRNCIADNSGQHPDLCYFYSFKNLTFRYCTFYNCDADGVFCAGTDVQNNIVFYGCVFDVGPQGGGWCMHLTCGPNVPPTLVNNTFIGWPADAILDMGQYGLATYGGPYACISNNIFWNCVNRLTRGVSLQGGATGANGDYNLYNNNNGGVGLGTETHSINTSLPASSVFVDFANRNYRLIAGSPAINSGATMASTYATDSDGDTRGAGGAWDIGAFESGGAPSTNPVILVTPSAMAAGYLLTNTSSTNIFTVQNVGGGTLHGNATPIFGGGFQLLGSTSYNLTNGQTATVTVKFAPSSVAAFSQPFVFSAGGGSTNTAAGVGMEAFEPGKVFVATNGQLTGPWSLTSTGAVFQATEIDSPASSGQAMYWVHAPATGSYEVNGYILSPSDANNSCYITFDGANVEANPNSTIWDMNTNVVFTWNLAENRGNGAFNADQFNPKVWTLSAGYHQLFVGGREANVYLGALQLTALAGPQPPNGLRIVRVTP